MKFLVDMPLSPEVARWLGERGYDAIHASEQGLSSAPDTAILDRARNEQRIVVTADLDYPRLLALTRDESPALILFRGGNLSEQQARDRLARVLDAVPSEELSRSIIVIEKSRIRRRRLPIKPAS
jgi:predicted nuclease of predicted toxin-antitoxin system